MSEDLTVQDPPSKPMSTSESVMEMIQETASSRRPSAEGVTASAAPVMVTAQLELTGRDKIVVLEVLQHTDYHQGSTSSRTSGPSSLVHTVIPTSKTSTQTVENLLSNDTCVPPAPTKSKSKSKPSRSESQLHHLHQEEIVIGKQVQAAKGMLVKLTSQGLASMDERVLCLSGSNDGQRQGIITKVMNDGKICAVSWHARPNEEHFYRTGRWGKWELQLVAVAPTQNVPPGGRLEERVGMVQHVGGTVEHVVCGISDSLGAAAPGIFRGGKASSYEEFLVSPKLNDALNCVDHRRGQVRLQDQKRAPLIISPLRLASAGRPSSVETKGSSREFTISPEPPTVSVRLCCCVCGLCHNVRVSVSVLCGLVGEEIFGETTCESTKWERQGYVDG